MAAQDNPFEIDGTSGEPKLLEQLRKGETCLFDKNAPAQSRTIRGPVLARLLRGEWREDGHAISMPRQVGISQAIITGIFDMPYSDTGLNLAITHSQFDKAVNFRGANFSRLDFTFCDMKGANFGYAKIESGLWMDDIQSTEELTLDAAWIGGQLNLCSEKRRVKISGNRHAINAQGAEIKGGVFLRGAKLTGTAAFNSAIIGGQFSANSTDKYQTDFINPNGDAIFAQGAEIKGSVFLHGAKLTGTTAFNSATIGGQFAATSTGQYRAEFINPNGHAINAQGAEIKADVFLRGAKLTGIADFSSATIGGQFAASSAGRYRAEFINPNGKALNLESAKIKDETFLTDFLHPPIGAVNFTSAHLGHLVVDPHSYPLGKLRLNGTIYNNFTDRRNSSHICEGWLSPITAKSRQKWQNKKDKQKDDPLKPFGYWPAFRALMERIEQGHIPREEGKSDSETAQNILARHIKSRDNHRRHPFAYRQFAKVLDGNGHEAEAREVRITGAKAYTERAAKNLKFRKPFYKAWRCVLGLTTAYGEKLQNAAYGLILLFIFGWVIFALNAPDMVPARERFYLNIEAYELWLSNGELPSGYPAFNPFIYSLDVILPIVDIAQESHWRPRNSESGENWLRCYNRFHLLMGWFLSTIGLAGLTGLLKDKRE